MGSEATRTRSTRVLLCDDTHDLVVLLAAEFGLHPDLEVVGEAATGKEAISLAREERPDVVVLDLAMPEMDGLQALPEILRVAPKSKVIVLSAFESKSMAEKVLELGAERYVEKGADAVHIADVVKEVASG